MLKRKILMPISAALFIAGATILIYPSVSNKATSIKHQQLIRSYEIEISATTEGTDSTTSLAEQYNDIVRTKGGYGFTPSEQELEIYNSALVYNADGMMGYISIPQLSISVPIYHTSTQEVLQAGIGHIESTSLPIGGASNHSVLTGHSGMSNAKMFTKIDRLKLGETFMLNILDKELYYEIYNIATVLPDETELLKIQDGEDICTLITCTPYGANTHRLLVQGKRIDWPIDAAN